MHSPPPRRTGHFRYKRLIEGRFPKADQRDLKEELCFFAGDTVRLEVQIVDDCGDPHDITEFDVTFTVKCEEWDAVILYQINSIDDPKHANKTVPEKGVIELLIEASVTRAWETGQYVFDVELSRDPADPTCEREIYTALRSWFALKRDITGYPGT